MKGNVIVGQSGGPTAVINSSLVGVYKTAKDRGAKKIYGMLHGVQGLLEEKVVDLSEHIRNDLDIELLKRTPSSYLAPAGISCPTLQRTKKPIRKFCYPQKAANRVFLLHRRQRLDGHHQEAV